MDITDENIVMAAKKYAQISINKRKYKLYIR